jgi:glycosyltransferase involved in cell wall biosynthesis
MKKTYYIDTYSTNNLHEVFNASSLLMFSKIFRTIEYRADKSSKINVEILLSKMPDNVNYKPIVVINARNVLGRFIKQIFATITNCYYIYSSNITDTVIINYNTMLSVYFINVATFIFNKKVIVICHGEMYYLKYERKTSLLFKKNKQFFKSSKTNLANGLYFAVLGDFILNNLRDVVSSQVLKKMFSIDHSFVSQNVVRKIQSDKNFQIGIIGSLRKSKGLDELLTVVKKCREINKNIDFVIVGSFDYETSFLKENGFTIPDGIDGSFLSRKKMGQLISSLDYALYLLPKDIYQFTASGSFFDAIDCEIPIIALKNDFFEYYQEKYGSYGYLVDTLDEIIDVICKSTTNKKSTFDVVSVKKKILNYSLDSEMLNINCRLFN